MSPGSCGPRRDEQRGGVHKCRPVERGLLIQGWLRGRLLGVPILPLSGPSQGPLVASPKQFIPFPPCQSGTSVAVPAPSLDSFHPHPLPPSSQSVFLLFF